MAEQMVTCRHCKTKIPKSEAYHNDGSNVYYCSLLCLNSANQKKLHKEQKNYKSVKGTDRRLVTDMLQNMYYEKGVSDARIPWHMLGSQMKNLLDEHKNWGYDTIYAILWYMTKIKEMDLLSDLDASPLNLVPYYEIEANDYIEQTKKINELANNFEIPEPTIMKGSRQNKRQRFKKITF